MTIFTRTFSVVVTLTAMVVLIRWFARRKLLSPAMDEYSDYSSTQKKNREVFRRNFDSDIRAFKTSLTNLRGVWARLGTTRDTAGRSNAGLLPFSNILVRHLIFGFEHVASYQSFLAWLTFRPGLEALLMIGKFVDDPANAKIWRDREVNVNAYRQTFEGKALESSSLARSSDFRQLLTRLNSEFMHPNPVFAYRDATMKREIDGILLEIQFFDANPEVHEAHLLAYLNLVDLIVAASESLVSRLYGSTGAGVAAGTYAANERSRGVQLAEQNTVAKKVMEELGLWKL